MVTVPRPDVASSQQQLVPFCKSDFHRLWVMNTMQENKKCFGVNFYSDSELHQHFIIFVFSSFKITIIRISFIVVLYRISTKEVDSFNNSLRKQFKILTLTMQNFLENSLKFIIKDSAFHCQFGCQSGSCWEGILCTWIKHNEQCYCRVTTFQTTFWEITIE